MKKVILMLFAAFVYGGYTINAQRQQREKMNPEKMIEMRTNRMVKQYKLSEEQALKLSELNKLQFEKMKGTQPKPLSKDSLNAMSEAARKDYKTQRKAQMEETRKAREKSEVEFQEELKKIFTPEQFEQYQKDEQARKERMKYRRRGGNTGGHPHQGRGFDDEF